MIHKISNPSMMLCFFAMLTAICLARVIFKFEKFLVISSGSHYDMIQGDNSSNHRSSTDRGKPYLT